MLRNNAFLLEKKLQKSIDLVRTDLGGASTHFVPVVI